MSGLRINDKRAAARAAAADQPARHYSADDLAHSKARLAARHEAERLELQQSEEAERQTRNLATELETVRRFLLRECKYDPLAGVECPPELRPTGKRPARLPGMNVLARAVKFGVVALMVGETFTDRREAAGLGVLAKLAGGAPCAS